MRSLRSVLSILLATVLTCAIAPALADASAPASAGTVYTTSNSPAGNQVLVYRRGADGALEFSAGVATGGRGTGGGLGNQGGVIVSEDAQWLVAVNPGAMIFRFSPFSTMD